MPAKISIPRGKRAASGVLITLFEAYQLIWPDLMPDQWENWVYRFIAVLGASGILDYYLHKKIDS